MHTTPRHIPPPTPRYSANHVCPVQVRLQHSSPTAARGNPAYDEPPATTPHDRPEFAPRPPSKLARPPAGGRTFIFSLAFMVLIEEEEKLCRFCFEGEEEGELLSPCNCKSGQQYVHLKCLRR